MPQVQGGSKNNLVISGTQPEIFQGRGGFVELGHFNKHFVKNTIKKPRREKFWSFFPWILLKLYFEWQI